MTKTQRKRFWQRWEEKRVKKLKEHLDANREKAIRMSRAKAFRARVRTHMAHDWNVYISDDGKKVTITDRVVVLNRMLKELGLKKKIRDKNAHISTGRREIWGYLDFLVDRDFDLVPKRKPREANL